MPALQKQVLPLCATRRKKRLGSKQVNGEWPGVRKNGRREMCKLRSEGSWTKPLIGVIDLAHIHGKIAFLL